MRYGIVLTDTAPHTSDPLLVGHKFARQAQLRAAGYEVPEFICVPASAFDRVLERARADIPELVHDSGPEDMTVWAGRAGAAVLNAGVPEGLVEELLEHFDRLAGDAGVVAVRSCAVPGADGTEGGEDSAADPFAGLGRSFLAVGRDELADRVSECWASAFTVEGVLYRATRGGDPAATRMAVGIQRLVPATRSFVAFSRDPRRGAERCLIAAAHGLGEGVVQEQADVDHFSVDPETGEVEPRTVIKKRRVVPHAEGGTTIAPVPEVLADLPVLDDPAARRIADLATALERHFGVPQDIEGAITADGTIHLVQARPAVVADSPSATTPEHELHWSNGNISESFAGFTSMLTYSVASELYAVGFEELYRSVGVSERSLRRHRYELRRMLGYLDGRVYMRLESWYRLHGQIRSFGGVKRQWERAVVTAESSVEPPAPSRARRWAARVREVPAAALRRALAPARMRGFFAWWDQQRASLPDPATRTPAQLVRDYRELWADVALRWGGTLVPSSYVIRELDLAERLTRRWTPTADRGVLNGMLCDGPVNRSVEALRSLVALAQAVADHPGARAAVLGDAGTDRASGGEGTAEAWRRMSGGEFGDRLAEMALRHVGRYGDRGLHDLKLETTVVSQRPEILIDQVRPLVTSGRDVTTGVEEERRARQRAERELRAHCANPARRAALRVLFWSLRRNLYFRENARFCRTELMGASRRMVRALGGHLVAAGELDSVEDVYDLTIDELLGAYESGSPGARLRELVRVRAAAREDALGREEPSRVFATDADLPISVALRSTAAARPEQEGAALSGLASSGGVVRARARVVTEPDVDPESCRDRILVARETDPGWMPLLLVAKGLVAERGTVLSHMAITGRVFGVPTVVAVHGAVERIPDGALIEVDGDRGTVTVLDGPASESAA